MTTERTIEKLQPKRGVLVLGAGISGLSSGILLQKEGYDVTIWAQDLPPNTTSNKAAALWQPFLSGPVDKVPGWGKQTLNFYREEMEKNPDCGVIKMRTVLVFEELTPDPWWSDAVDEIRRIDPKNLPQSYVDGYEFDGIVIDTRKYLDYLIDSFKNLGGEIVQKKVQNVSETTNNQWVVVNCTGLGSRELFGDNLIYPSRGQTVKIKPNGFDYSLSDDRLTQFAYIIPRIDDIVLGGTEEDNNWNLEPDPEQTRGILERCAALDPAFRNAEIVEVSVGLRPVRPEIRLEVQHFGEENYIVHNYGHGGSGFTLCWGCAENVVELVNGICKK